MRRILLALCVLAVLADSAAAESLLAPMTPDQVDQARRFIAAFKADRRGPFHRIRWFCNDGTDHPPSPYPCRERGGGRQHASLKPEAAKLAAWNVDVSTILAGKPFEQLFDAGRDHHRLKQLVLERYLEQIDDGWIYRRAYSYRGARQIEDEEKAGQAFLEKALSDRDWARKRRLLATRLLDAVPHAAPSSAVAEIRTLCEVIAEQDSRFQPLRAKIHSSPDATDLDAVRLFRSETKPRGEAEQQIGRLIELLDREQSGQALAERLPAFRRTLEEGPAARCAARLAEALKSNDRRAVYASAAALAREIAREAAQSSDGKANLRRFDFLNALSETAFAASPDTTGRTRKGLLEDLEHDFALSYAAGLFSERQLIELESNLAEVLENTEQDAESYFFGIGYLMRSTEWATATASREFGPVSQRYARFEPKADDLVDHVLRGSPALAMARRLEILFTDASHAVGVKHEIFGEPASGLALGLNAGVAEGTLKILDPTAKTANVDPQTIYVIPQTVSDLHPMAGVLTLDSGNALSHTQLLAANLGIPNAVISSRLLPSLERFQGRRVFYSVGERGGVVLRAANGSGADRSAPKKVRLPAEDLDLSRRGIIPLQDLRPGDAGVIVGPKAANLGALMQMFPGRVAAGFAIPFGVFAAHDRRTAGGPTPAEQIRESFAEARRLEASGAPRSEVAGFIRPKLAEIRERIQNMPLIPEFEAELRRALRERFGESGAYGVFVRSDTNAEDLPEFTGAGLNLSEPNRVGEESIIQAIRDVWASPFTERAYEWRSRAFENPEDVFPSVVVMRTVASEKSGVIATMNLYTGERDEITVNVAEGVSAVVDGGVAESLRLLPDGGVMLMAQARLTYRKVVDPKGGLKIVPPSNAETLLNPREIRQIRDLVGEVIEKYPKALDERGEPLPFDIEFGFENGKLWLFQIRPLVRRGSWEESGWSGSDKVVRLDEVPQ